MTTAFIVHHFSGVCKWFMEFYVAGFLDGLPPLCYNGLHTFVKNTACRGGAAMGENMNWDFLFFFNSILLGVGLAMDAFSVSLANGLREPQMKTRKMCGIAGVFGGFQALMPLIGWVCVHTVVQYFRTFERVVPFIALALLGIIGGKMLFDGIRSRGTEPEPVQVGLGGLLLQGVATSIDALSVGFTIAAYDIWHAAAAALLIAAVTFAICIGGLVIGCRFGMRLAGKATILGGCILIFIGIEIFLSGILS